MLAGLQVLRASGLRSEIDIPTFLACAQEVGSQGQRVLGSADTAARSHTLDTAAMLAEHYAENASLLHGPQLYTGIANLAFVPATQVCCMGFIRHAAMCTGRLLMQACLYHIHDPAFSRRDSLQPKLGPQNPGCDLCMQGLPGSSTASQTLVTFQAAALHKDWHLAWAVAPVLQQKHSPPSWTWVQLKLRSPPPLPMVCPHVVLQGIICANNLAPCSSAQWRLHRVS